jgi:hypothetical protein
VLARFERSVQPRDQIVRSRAFQDLRDAEIDVGLHATSTERRAGQSLQAAKNYRAGVGLSSALTARLTAQGLLAQSR